MLLLTDVYCLLNRARGTQLISPPDCLAAAVLLAQVDTPLRLQEFDSGVKAIVAHGAAEQVALRIRNELLEEQRRRKEDMPINAYDTHGDAASMSPLALAHRWHISIILAKTYLLLAEEREVLCRDESTQGLTFYINQF
jgi:ESCRT-II complex subunit VPS36